MNRMGFLGFMVGGLAAEAAVRTFPFRVYSFPSEPIYVDDYAMQVFSAFADSPRTEWVALALQLEKVRKQLPVLYQGEREMWKILDVDHKQRSVTIGSRALRLPVSL